MRATTSRTSLIRIEKKKKGALIKGGSANRWPWLPNQGTFITQDLNPEYCQKTQTGDAWAVRR